MAAKKKFVPRRKRKFLWIFPIIPFLLILLFTFLPSETEFFLGARSFKPKSTTALPADIQKAIAMEAVKELTQGYDYKHPDVAAQVDPGDLQIAQSPILADNPLYFFKETGRSIQELFAFDSLSKTKLILKHNSWKATEALSLLEKSSKQNIWFIRDYAVSMSAGQISGAEDRFNQILSLSEKEAKTDKDKAKAISDVAFNYAEKYFRDELILQGLEEKFDDSSLVKIENARLKGLGVFAKILVSKHPDPQVLSRLIANSIASEAGTNYKELKTAEFLQELEDAAPSDSQKLPLRLSQYILVERFERKVLSMPFNKRRELLDTLVNEIPGNPMREFKTFSRIRRVFASRELIVYGELYKAKILEHFENRVLGLSSSDLQNKFVENFVKDPADLRILEALELRAQGQTNIDPKLSGIIKNLKTSGYSQISKLYGNNSEKLKDTLFYESAIFFPDVLDVKVAVDLDKALGDTGFVKDLEKQVVHEFVSNLPQSLSGVTVNASSETTSLLEEIVPYIMLSSQNEFSSAITAEVTLDSVVIPETTVEINNLVNNLEQNQDVAIVTQNLQVPIDEVIQQADTVVSQPSIQEVVQRTEELTQEIFSAPAGQETPIEEQLPPVIQQEIQQVQQTTNSVPQVTETLVETVVNTVEQAPFAPAPVAPAPQAPAVSAPETPPPATISAPSL